MIFELQLILPQLSHSFSLEGLHHTFWNIQFLLLNRDAVKKIAKQNEQILDIAVFILSLKIATDNFDYFNQNVLKW